ncbi:hypothetical protein P43SY_003042 [Pythium insidiosum]|uniref:Uncharacterized protein n=1 Tax=Pythium insidiosum TaxID=114742 RepID=A0AAD5LMM9_PYTIN|nr:hypothetical protein P43SY_003042 [Pythium insidiosum]
MNALHLRGDPAGGADGKRAEATRRFAPVKLRPEQLDAFHEQAQELLSNAIREYVQVGQDKIDTTRWRFMRSCDGLAVFRDRRPLNAQLTSLLCAGTIPLSLADALKGFYADNTQDARAQAKMFYPRFVDVEVLANIQRRSKEEPLAYTGLKCLRLTGLASMGSRTLDDMEDDDQLLEEIECSEQAHDKDVRESVIEIRPLRRSAQPPEMLASVDGCSMGDSLHRRPVCPQPPATEAQQQQDLLARLVQASSRAEQTFLLASANTLVAHSIQQRNRLDSNKRHSMEVMSSVWRSLVHTSATDAAAARKLLERIHHALLDVYRAKLTRDGADVSLALTVEEIAPIKALCDELTPAHLGSAHGCKPDETPPADRYVISSRSIFILPPGSSIPLHDHPEMSVISRVLYGRLHVKSFDLADSKEARHSFDLADSKEARHVRSLLERADPTASCEPRHVARLFQDEVVTAPHTTDLLPDRGNLHEFVADDQVGCAIFDILTPPYESDDGRDCTYYRVVGEPVTADNGKQYVELEEFEPQHFEVVSEPRPGTLYPQHGEREANQRPNSLDTNAARAMARIWLRLELFEHGLLQLPSKVSATLSVASIKRSMEALHARLATAAGNSSGVEEDDVNMDDASMADEPRAPSYHERDNLVSVSFSCWKDAVAPIFQWREQDYKAFWLLLVQFHRKIPVNESFVVSPSTVLDEEQCLGLERVPIAKIAIYLFIQTVKPHTWRQKYSLETFNAVWYQENDVAASGTAGGVVAAAAAAIAAGAAGSPVQPSGSMSPQLRASTSPPPPPSPHTVGMQDRSTSDAYYLEFVRDKLDELFAILYPSAEMNEESESTVSAEQIDLLGFLLCTGGPNMLDFSQSLSTAYPDWRAEADATMVANAAKVCAHFKKLLYLNEMLYPPVGFSLAHAHSGPYSPVVGAAGRAFSLSGDDISQEEESYVMQRPTVLSNLYKTTVVKRAEDFVDKHGNSDLIIFSCHDAYIYVLGPVTAISGLIRVSNCLDSIINSYTLVPLVMTGENVGVRLGPYNSRYPGLAQQMATAQLSFRNNSVGAWDAFLNLESETDLADSEKESIALQSPATFRETCVPVKIKGLGPAERPFPLPAPYADALRQQQDVVEALRRLVCSDEFDLSTKRSMETVIQMRFKEWLNTTGNVRQILDLVQIEKTRTQQQQQVHASPAKERA